MSRDAGDSQTLVVDRALAARRTADTSHPGLHVAINADEGELVVRITFAAHAR